MRVLVIEDEVQLARHIVRALERHGHEARAQHDGAKGLEAAVARPPDLVVLDLNLPDIDGLAVLGKLHEDVCPARILVLTARGEVEDGRAEAPCVLLPVRALRQGFPTLLNH